ncbi:DNA glycosylase [Biscogniauxia mediterranea]|nr:DNA glycosylase [Biscogniauxia mediterranea]
MARDGNQDNTAAVPTVEASIKEPSFEGRLQLNDFMFKAGPSTDAIRTTASSSAPPGMRRSARLLTTSRSSSSSSSTSPLPSTAQTQLSKSKTRGKPTTLSSQPSSSTASPSTASPKRKPSTNTTTTTTTASYFPSSSSSSSPRIKKRRARQTYAPPSTYAHLPLLPDALGPELLVLFVGLNPGLETARTGHAYAHPSNLFWKLLRASGLTPGQAVYRAADDRELPRRCGLGLTNIVARPTRSGAELARAELDAGVAALEAKCRACRPECVCLVGKSIWESVVRVRRGGRALAKGEFAYGWQGDERFGAVPEGEGEGEGEEGTTVTTPWEGARIFVATSTSGLAASLRPEEKERIWKVLGDWCVERRKEREREKEKEEKEKADGSVKTEKGRGEEANASETTQPEESEP